MNSITGRKKRKLFQHAYSTSSCDPLRLGKPRTLGSIAPHRNRFGPRPLFIGGVLICSCIFIWGVIPELRFGETPLSFSGIGSASSHMRRLRVYDNGLLFDPELGSGPNSFEAFGLSGRYLGGDGVGVSSPVSFESLECDEAVTDGRPRDVLVHRLAPSREPTESKDDAEDIDDDLEKANGDDVADESESFIVSGLEVIEQDKDDRRVNIVDRMADDAGRGPGHLLDKKAISSVVHLCN